MAGKGVFVHLHVHSYYSFFDSTLPPAEIAVLAREAGSDCVALTDTNCLSGAVEFYKAVREAGLKPILGAEVRQPLAPGRELLRQRAAHPNARMPAAPAGGGAAAHWNCPPARLPVEPEDETASESTSPALCPGDASCRAVLLARSFAGYSEISHVVTRRMLDPEFDLLCELKGLSADIIVLSDCPAALTACVGGGAAVYAELMPSRGARQRNRAVYECARAAGIPLVVACDARMAKPQDAPLHNMLQAMRRLTTIHHLAEDELVDPALHFQGEAAMCEFFGLGSPARSFAGSLHNDIAEAINNTRRISDVCNCELPLGEWKFLRFDGLREPPGRMLRELTERGVRRRYGTPPPPEALERMNYELSVIEKLKFTEYFLLVNRIVEEAHSRGFHTVGRGSAANSIVSYALGLTNVCPLRYNLYFERFLNPERNSPPDIDIDFSWKERDDVIRWCFEFFGHERVALISTIQTLRMRQAVREVAKAHGIGEKEVNAFNALRETGYRIEALAPAGPPGGDIAGCVDLSVHEPWRTVLEQAQRITGFPRHLSIHCGGIIIAPRNVVDYVPLTRSAKGFVITQMDMYSVEDLGLIKIDLLSNRSLGVLRDALDAAERNRACSAPEEVAPDTASADGGYNEEIFRREAVRMKAPGTRRGTSVALAGIMGMRSEVSASSVCAEPVAAYSAGAEVVAPGEGRDPCVSLVRKRVLDFEYVTGDAATRLLIDAGMTMGCFYIESPGMRALFERLRCRNFEEVVAASSIIRPGVAESGMMQEYIARHQAQARDEVAVAVGGSRGGHVLPADPRSPTTLLPASRASLRMAAGNMPINAHAKSRPLPHANDGGSHSGATDGEPSPHPLMLRILPETYGVMVYQEDVLRVAHEVAGMSLGEADLLRRAMSGKMRSNDAMEQIRTRFFAGAGEKGLCDADANEIWRQISSFAGYSFCKGHSAAFAVLSYQIAYLKAHYPAEFFAAVLSNGGGFYSAGAYVSEARRWGMKILLPCVNASELDYAGCTQRSGTGTRHGNRGWVRIGLSALKGVSAKTCRRIVRERARRGAYQSMDDLITRSGVGLEECRVLIKAGALDAFSAGSAGGRTMQTVRPRLLLEAEYLFREREMMGDSLLSVANACPAARLDWSRSEVAPHTASQICRFEMEILGYMVSAHPLDFVLPAAAQRSRGGPPIIEAADIRKYAGRRVRMAGWAIAWKLLAAKNNGRLMKMVTMEDRTDTFEAVLFPRVYERYAPRTLSCGPYLVEGRIDVTLGSPTLNVEKIELLRAG